MLFNGRLLVITPLSPIFASKGLTNMKNFTIIFIDFIILVQGVLVDVNMR
jgi:hypothetical protein